MIEFSISAPGGLPEITPGDDLIEIFTQLFRRHPLRAGDIVAVTHKIVSKAEGCLVDLATIHPGVEAVRYGEELNKDPRLIQVILNESTHILFYGLNRPMICRHKLGFICANAAVDLSNVRKGFVLTLPKDPDNSARQIRRGLEATFGAPLGVLICDTQGRPFRSGACGIAIGSAGILPIKNYVGETDRNGREMKNSAEGQGDELAAAATLVMGQGAEGRPLALIRGFPRALGDGDAAALIRPTDQDIFFQALQDK